MDKTHEIMQKVRRIELRARRLAATSFAGEYRSGFRGQGLDFDDFREYAPGDDPRFIDWKVTARTGTPYVRKFHEEREQILLLAVDASGSMRYAGPQSEDTKLEYAAQIAAVLAYSAALNGDKAGLLLYGNGERSFYLPPAKGAQQCLRIVREILKAPGGRGDHSFSHVAEEILRTQHKRAMLILMSDFLYPADKPAMGKLAFRHELIPVRINDAVELEPPAAGMVSLINPETGQQACIDLGIPALRAAHARALRSHYAEWDHLLNQLGIDLLTLRTDEDYLPPLRRLFKRRSRLIVR